jgi:hypothetical protein
MWPHSLTGNRTAQQCGYEPAVLCRREFHEPAGRDHLASSAGATPAAPAARDPASTCAGTGAAASAAGRGYTVGLSSPDQRRPLLPARRVLP